MGPKPALEAITPPPRAQRECQKLTQASLRAQDPSRVAPYALQTSSNELVNHLAEHVGESEITPLKTVSQLLVIETQKPQDRGMQVMHVDLVHRRVESEVIRLSQCDTRTNPSAGHPH